MLSKISSEEVIKGFISDYSKIKDPFKEILHNNGFRWQKCWERQHFYGSEGVWLSYISKLSIRIRWGKVNKSAIIYVEKEFFDSISKFCDSYEIVEGMQFPYYDYDLLNKGELLKKVELLKNEKKKRKKSAGKTGRSDIKKNKKRAGKNTGRNERKRIACGEVLS